jgi:HK97 family phage major capsid protein
MARPAWLIGPKMTRKLRTTPKNAGAMVFEGKDLLGHQVIQTSAIPENMTKGTSTDCAALVFGDLSEIFVGFWGPAALDLIVDGYTLAKSAKIRIVARAEVGIAARRVGAFAAVKDALTA